MQRHDFEYDRQTPYQRSHTSRSLAWNIMVAYHRYMNMYVDGCHVVSLKSSSNVYL